MHTAAANSGLLASMRSAKASNCAVRWVILWLAHAACKWRKCCKSCMNFGKVSDSRCPKTWALYAWVLINIQPPLKNDTPLCKQAPIKASQAKKNPALAGFGQMRSMCAVYQFNTPEPVTWISTRRLGCKQAINSLRPNFSLHCTTGWLSPAPCALMTLAGTPRLDK